MGKLLEPLINFFINSLFGDTISKDKDCKHELKTERKMGTEDHDGLEQYHRMQIGSYFVKMKMIKE